MLQHSSLQHKIHLSYYSWLRHTECTQYDPPRHSRIFLPQENIVPIAVVVSQVPLSYALSLLVVQPLLPPPQPPLRTLGSEPRGSKLVSETTVSPTSVITFEHRASQSNVEELSGELSSSGAFEFSTGNDGSGDLSDLGESSRVLEETRSSSTAEFWDKSGIRIEIVHWSDECEPLSQ